MALAARSVADLEIALIGLQRASEANDLHTWTAKRRALDTEIADTLHVIDGAARAGGDRAAKHVGELRTRYAIAVTAAGAHAVPPRGFAPISLEGELMSAVTARPEGGYKVGLERKEAAIHALLERLDPAESRTLIARIAKPVPEDALAAAFRKSSNLGPERLARLLAFAKEAPRRAAIQAEIDDSLGPAPQAAPDPRPHDLVDGFDAATATVAKTYAFPEQREAPLPTHEHAAKYLTVNATAAWDDLRTYLHGVGWPDLAEGLAWRSEHLFSEQLVVRLRKRMPGLSREVLLDVLYPHDPYPIIDTLRPANERLTWVPAVGLALGQLVQRATASALMRVGPRMVSATDERGELDVSTVPISHPMERFVVAALRDPDVMTTQPVAGKRRAPARGKRGIKVTWQGKDAWNWVRADPADATAEEVIEAIIDQHGGSPSWFADALATAPPLFGVPARWARTIPAAAAHMPKTLGPNAFDLRSDTPEARLVELTRQGAASDTAAKAAAKPATKPLAAGEVIDVLADCSIQLGTIHRSLARWDLGELTAEALLRVSQKQAELLGAPANEVAAWGPIAMDQRRRLHDIADALRRIDKQLAKLSDADRRGGGAAPIRAVIRKLGGAAAASHIATASDALFAEAVRAQADLSIDSVQAQILDVAAANDVPRASHRAGDAPSDRPTDRRLANEAETAIADARVVQDRLINGRDVEEREIGDATLATQELALKARLEALFTQSGQLQVAAAEAGAHFDGWLAARFSKRFRTLRDVTKETRLHIDRVRGDWYEALHPDKKRSTDGSWPEVADPAKRRAALDAADRSYTEIRGDHELMTILKEGPSIIESQQLRKALVGIASLIVVGFVAQTAAGAVAESMGAAFMSAEGAETVGELSGFARNFTKATSTGVNIAVNTAGMVATTGASVGEAFRASLVFAFGGRVLAGPASAEVAEAKAMLRAFEEEAANANNIQRTIEGIWTTELKALGWAGQKAAGIAWETFSNVALSNLAAKLEGHPGATPQEARDWFLQALGVTVGKSVHASLGERMPSLERLARRTDATVAERRLLADAKQLEQLAATLAKIGGADTALKVLAERTQLLERELAVVEWRARWEHEPGAKEEVDARRAELETQLEKARGDGMVAIRMSLIGLQELVPGQTWRGTPEDIRRAATELTAAGHTVGETWDPARRVTTLTVDGTPYEVYERPAATPARATEPTRGAPRASHEMSTELEMVPGSALRGTARGASPASPADQAALEREALSTMPRVVAAADVNGIEPLGGRRFLVTMRDGTLTIIEVSIVRIEDHDVARILPNSSRETKIGNRTARGEHVIQLSSHLPLDQVERALAHAVARLTTVHERGERGSFADGPRDNAGNLVGLSADATGRLAELRVLVAQLGAHPDTAASIRREILALADHLGAVGSDPAAKARRAQLEQQLTPKEREELDLAGRDEAERSRTDRATLDEVREAARQDIADDLARQHERGNDRHAQYDLSPGNRMSREDIAVAAAAAARLRSLESHRTLQRLRAEGAKLAAGQYPRVEQVQVGGGLALAGRLPTTLLVDLRGRWQADGSQDIAQTAQQLGELYKARFGDTRQVAGPKERVPIEAIRFWEDSLAAMGPVIDGAASLRMEGDRMLVDITPTDGSPAVTIEVGGVPTVATGFVPEAVPGAPRMNVVDVVTTLETQLDVISRKEGVSAELKDAAEVALTRLRAIVHPRATDGVIAEALSGPHEAELKEALRKLDTDKPVSTPKRTDQPPPVKTKAALKVVEGAEAWGDLKARDAADGVQQIAFGDESNLEQRVSEMLTQLDASRHPSPDRPIHAVIAGAGGTAVSAAELILRRPNTVVTMLGRGTPEGLLKNPQFEQLASQHADAELARQLGTPPGDGRLKMYLDKNLSFSVPDAKVGADGHQTFEAYPAREGHEGEFTGDMYVVSAGRADQTPPIVSDMILQTTRANGSVSYRADFDADGQYTGYSVILRDKNGKIREVKITGAASRYIPIDDLEAQRPGGEDAARDVRNASGMSGQDSTDVPSATGGFAGGAAGSAIQGSRHAARANRPPPKQGMP